MWHERCLLHPCGELGTRHWVVATPDYKSGYGRHVEELTISPDITRIKALGANGKRPYLDEEIYAFAEPLDDDELLKEIGEARKEARAHVATFYYAVTTYLQRVTTVY